MSNNGGFTIAGLGSLALRTVGHTVAEVDVYVSPTGNDLTGQGTQARPYRTLEWVETLLPTQINHEVRIHLKSGTYELPSRSFLFRPRLLNRLVRILADEAWDPNVYNVIGGNRTAAAATTASVVKAAGLVVNALQDKSIRFTSGDAAGQYRTIRNNTATDIIPVAAFSPAPAPGDSYQVFTNNTILQLPDDPTGFGYEFIFNYDCAGLVGYQSFTPPATIGGFCLEGINIIASEDASGASLYFGIGAVFMFGCAMGAGTSIFHDCDLLPGYDVSVAALMYGWGLVNESGPFGGEAGTAAFFGFCNETNGGDIFQGNKTLYGGRKTGGRILTSAHNVNINGTAATPFLWGAGSNGIEVRDGAEAAMSGVTFAGGIDVNSGGYLRISSGNVSSPGPISAESGGRIFLIGSPANIGGAGNDWTVTGVAAFNKAFFASNNTFKAGTDLSLIARDD